MKNIMTFLTRLMLVATVLVGLVAATGGVPAYAKKKASTEAAPASTEASSMAEGNKGKPEAKHHREKKHNKENKSAAELTGSTNAK